MTIFIGQIKLVCTHKTYFVASSPKICMPCASEILTLVGLDQHVLCDIGNCMGSLCWLVVILGHNNQVANSIIIIIF